MRACLVILALLFAMPVQAQTLIGSTFGLEGWFQETPGRDVVRVRVPASATVRHPGVEFPRVQSLFDTPEARQAIREGRLNRFVNTWIDIGPNWIEIDFRRAGSGQFTRAHMNTYVFVFDKASPVRLEDARIHPRTTLGISPGRLSTRGNRLFLNVQGLRYASGSFVRIVFDVQSAAGQVPSAPEEPPRPAITVEDSPIPGRAPRIADNYGG